MCVCVCLWRQIVPHILCARHRQTGFFVAASGHCTAALPHDDDDDDDLHKTARSTCSGRRAFAFCYLILFKLNLSAKRASALAHACARAQAMHSSRPSLRQVNGPAATGRSLPHIEMPRARTLARAYLRSRLAAKRRQWQMNIEVKCAHGRRRRRRRRSVLCARAPGELVPFAIACI